MNLKIIVLNNPEKKKIFWRIYSFEKKETNNNKSVTYKGLLKSVGLKQDDTWFMRRSVSYVTLVLRMYGDGTTSM